MQCTVPTQKKYFKRKLGQYVNRSCCCLVRFAALKCYCCEGKRTRFYPGSKLSCTKQRQRQFISHHKGSDVGAECSIASQVTALLGLMPICRNNLPGRQKILIKTLLASSCARILDGLQCFTYRDEFQYEIRRITTTRNGGEQQAALLRKNVFV